MLLDLLDFDGEKLKHCAIESACTTIKFTLVYIHQHNTNSNYKSAVFVVPSKYYWTMGQAQCSTHHSTSTILDSFCTLFSSRSPCFMSAW